MKFGIKIEAVLLNRWSLTLLQFALPLALSNRGSVFNCKVLRKYEIKESELNIYCNLR
jgi:hypothetical protein